MNKEEKIINAAIKLLLRENYQNMKTSEIAKEADVAEGTIYRYFKNKKDLFIHAIRYYNSTLFTFIYEGISKELSLETNLDLLGTNFYNRIHDKDAKYKIIYKAFSEVEDDEIREELKNTLDSILDPLKEMLHWAKEKEEIKIDSENIEMISMSLWGIAEIFWKKHIIGYHAPIEKSEIDKMIQIYIKILK